MFMIPGLFRLIMYLQQEPKHKSVPGSPINNTTSGFFFRFVKSIVKLIYF